MCRFFLLLITAAGLLAAGHAGAKTPVKSVNVDTNTTVTKTAALAIAERFYNKAYAGISGKEKKLVDALLLTLQTNDPDSLHHAALALCNVTSLASGGGDLSENAATALSSAAFRAWPDNALPGNEFGALLHARDSLKASLVILLYARSLPQNSAILRTNIGNTLFELYDDRKAEAFYRQALKLRPDYNPARQGLILVYLKRGETAKAYQEMLNGVTDVVYNPMEQETGDVVKNSTGIREAKADPQNDFKLPPPPAAPGGSSPPAESLRLPDFPGWSNRQALANDASLQQLVDQLNALFAAANEAYGQTFTANIPRLQAIRKLPYAQQDSALKALNSVWAARGKQQLAILELLDDYYRYRIEKSRLEYRSADSSAAALMQKTIKLAAERTRQPLAKSGTDAEGGSDALVTYCKDATAALDVYFATWKRLAARHHQETTDLLYEFWIYCEPYLNKTWTPDEWTRLNLSRKRAVYREMATLFFDYSQRKSLVTFASYAALSDGQLSCPEVPAPPAAAAVKAAQIDVPDSKQPPCPFANTNPKISAGAFSLAIGCDAIEGEFLEGLGLDVKYNWVKKQWTVMPEVGFKNEWGIGPTTWGVSYKEGLYATFDAAGKVQDIGAVYEGTAGVKLGGIAYDYKLTSTLSVHNLTATDCGISPEMSREVTAGL